MQEDGSNSKNHSNSKNISNNSSKIEWMLRAEMLAVIAKPTMLSIHCHDSHTTIIGILVITRAVAVVIVIHAHCHWHSIIA